MKLIYKKTNKFYIGKIILTEGENEVSSEDWNIIKDHPQVKGYMKEGILSTEKKLTVIEEVEEDEIEEEEPKTFKEQLEDIAEITDIEKLEKMLDSEDRKTVIKAIEKQISSLKEIEDV